MSHAFDGHSFENILGDCARLLLGATDQEHQVASLLGLVEPATAESVSDGRADTGSGVGIESSAHARAHDVPATIRALCAAARQQRQLAETILVRLVGDLPSTQHGAIEEGNRVLVVDDNPDSSAMAAAVLEAFGFCVITASNGLEGVIVAHYARPIAVIMDLTMPILDGIQGARLLKSSAVTSHLNVIAYTAKPDAIEGPLARFFAHVLAKPTEPELLVTSVRQCLVPWPTRQC